jgi:hypothetical protein
MSQRSLSSVIARSVVSRGRRARRWPPPAIARQGRPSASLRPSPVVAKSSHGAVRLSAFIALRKGRLRLDPPRRQREFSARRSHQRGRRQRMSSSTGSTDSRIEPDHLVGARDGHSGWSHRQRTIFHPTITLPNDLSGFIPIVLLWPVPTFAAAGRHEYAQPRRGGLRALATAGCRRLPGAARSARPTGPARRAARTARRSSGSPSRSCRRGTRRS